MPLRATCERPAIGLFAWTCTKASRRRYNPLRYVVLDNDGGTFLAKPNYEFAKRQRDLAKKQKKEAKRQRKAEANQSALATGAGDSGASDKSTQ